MPIFDARLHKAGSVARQSASTITDRASPQSRCIALWNFDWRSKGCAVVSKPSSEVEAAVDAEPSPADPAAGAASAAAERPEFGESAKSAGVPVGLWAVVPVEDTAFPSPAPGKAAGPAGLDHHHGRSNRTRPHPRLWAARLSGCPPAEPCLPRDGGFIDDPAGAVQSGSSPKTGRAPGGARSAGGEREIKR